MYLERPDFIKHVSTDTGISLHQAENVLNAIFGHMKTMLKEETIQAVANDIEAGDLKTVWLTAQLAERELSEFETGRVKSKEAQRWH